MTGMKVIVIGDAGRTGVRIVMDPGTVLLKDSDPYSITVWPIVSTDSFRDIRKEDEERAAKAEERERERVRKMREGWKAIRKGHEWRR